MYFPVSGVEVFPLWPVASAFGISFFCSMSGISGAFLLLPYQLTVLNYVLPGVSATNQIFNIIACPGGVWRYAREGRLLAPLAVVIAIGTIPGVFIGALLRLTILASISNFMLFVSLVMFYLGLRILFQKPRKGTATGSCAVLHKSWRSFKFSFDQHVYKVDNLPLFYLSLVVGLIGGTYGIGGGAIMVPFLISFFGLPIYAVAGASLLATFLTSITGTAFYTLLAWAFHYPWAAPDWTLGLLLGLGGLGGMYSGAAMQKFVPAPILRFMLLTIIFFIATYYLIKAYNSLAE